MTSAEVAREAGVLYLLDACQSVGQAADRRRAPSAATSSRPPAASTCAARGVPASSTCATTLIADLEPPFLDLHAATLHSTGPLRDPSGRWGASRTGRPTTPAKIGLGVAVDYALAWGLEVDRGSHCRARRAPAHPARPGLDGVRVHDQGHPSLRHRHLHRRRGDGAGGATPAGRGGRERERVAGRLRPVRPGRPAGCRTSSVLPCTTTTTTTTSIASSAPSPNRP